MAAGLACSTSPADPPVQAAAGIPTFFRLSSSGNFSCPQPTREFLSLVNDLSKQGPQVVSTINGKYFVVPDREDNMKSTTAGSVEEYLDELPEERREALQAVRDTILKNLPEGYEEVINWGMITYQVPLETYPDTYNGKPLMYAALGNQKNHMSLYLTGVYMDEQRRNDFVSEYKETGKRMDMGKSCVRFKKLADLPLDLIGETIASLEVGDFVDRVKAARSPRKASQT